MTPEERNAVIEECALLALKVPTEPGNNIETRAQVRMRGRTHDALRALKLPPSNPYSF